LTYDSVASGDPELDPLDKAELRCKNFNPLMSELETSIENLPASKERAKMIFVAGVLRDKYRRAIKKSPPRRPEDRAAYPTCHAQIEELFRKALSERPWEPKKRLMSNSEENGVTEGQPSLKRQKLGEWPTTGATKLKAMSSTKLLEEDLHPWRVGRWTEIPKSGMLWRVWDKRSACRIDDSRVGFLAGSSDYCLGLAEDRSVSLTNHANWGCRIPSPFISTTSSFAEIVDERVPQLKKRQEKYKGQLINIKVTLIDVRARIAAKMPVLKMTTELDHYRVRTSYGDYMNSFFENEYLCPFVIHPAEIVGTFTWSSVEEWAKENNAPLERWAKVIGQKAFNEHENARLLGTISKSQLSCHCCGHTAAACERVSAPLLEQ
jgi:hypothetical protein